MISKVFGVQGVITPLKIHQFWPTCILFWPISKKKKKIIRRKNTKSLTEKQMCMSKQMSAPALRQLSFFSLIRKLHYTCKKMSCAEIKKHLFEVLQEFKFNTACKCVAQIATQTAFFATFYTYGVLVECLAKPMTYISCSNWTVHVGKSKWQFSQHICPTK